MSVDQVRDYISRTGEFPDGVWAVGGLFKKDFPQFSVMYSGEREVGIVKSVPEALGDRVADE